MNLGPRPIDGLEPLSLNVEWSHYLLSIIVDQQTQAYRQKKKIASVVTCA